MSTNPFYQDTSNPVAQTRGSSAIVRNEFALIQSGFDGVNMQFTATATSIATKGNIAGQAWTGVHDFSGATEIKIPAPVNPSDAVTLQVLQNAVSSAAATPVWASGTSYTVGQVIYSPFNLQNYRRAVAGAGTIDPSVDLANWTMIPSVKTVNYQSLSGNGNVLTNVTNTQTTGAVVTLTNQSPYFQSINFIALGLWVNLPDATTMPVGRNSFTFQNPGIYDFGVRDNTGNLVCVVPAGETVSVHLQGNGVSAGVWDFDKNALPFLKRLNLGANGSDAVVLCTLSATEVLLWSKSLTAIAYLNTSTPTSVTWVTLTGAGAALAVGANNGIQAVMISSSSVIITAWGGGTTLYTFGAQVTGGVASIGSSVTTTTTSGSLFQQVACTSGAVIVYGSTNTILSARVMTIAGTTITGNSTGNTATVPMGIAQVGLGVAVQTAGSIFIVAASTTSSGNTQVACLTVTTTTCSWGTILSLTSTSSPAAVSVYNYSANKFAVITATGGNTVSTISLSGTTLSIMHQGATCPGNGFIVLPGNMTFIDVVNGSAGFTIISDTPTVLTNQPSPTFIGWTYVISSTSFAYGISTTSNGSVDTQGAFITTLAGSTMTNTQILSNPANASVTVNNISGTSKVLLTQSPTYANYAAAPSASGNAMYAAIVDISLGAPAYDTTKVFIPSSGFAAVCPVVGGPGGVTPAQITSKVSVLPSGDAVYSSATFQRAIKGGMFYSVYALDGAKFALGLKSGGNSIPLMYPIVSNLYLLEVIQ